MCYARLTLDQQTDELSQEVIEVGECPLFTLKLVVVLEGMD